MIYTYLQIRLFVPRNKSFVPIFNMVGMATFTISLWTEANRTYVQIIQTYLQIICGYVVFVPRYK